MSPNVNLKEDVSGQQLLDFSFHRKAITFLMLFFRNKFKEKVTASTSVTSAILLEVVYFL